MDVSTQTEDTTDSVLATETTEVPPPNHEEELTMQSAIDEKAKEHYEQAKAKANQIRNHASKREAELQERLDA